MDGYRAGIVYLEAQAILNGFDCKWKYQEHLIQQAIIEEERQFAYAEKEMMYSQ